LRHANRLPGDHDRSRSSRPGIRAQRDRYGSTAVAGRSCRDLRPVERARRRPCAADDRVNPERHRSARRAGRYRPRRNREPARHRILGDDDLRAVHGHAALSPGNVRVCRDAKRDGSIALTAAGRRERDPGDTRRRRPGAIAIGGDRDGSRRPAEGGRGRERARCRDLALGFGWRRDGHGRRPSARGRCHGGDQDSPHERPSTHSGPDCCNCHAYSLYGSSSSQAHRLEEGDEAVKATRPAPSANTTSVPYGLEREAMSSTIFFANCP